MATMIEKFVKRFEQNKDELRKKFTEHPDYKTLVKWTVEVISSPDEWNDISPERIHEINDGDYQGMLVYVIACREYQPSVYWYVTVHYGSCSGCDTLEAIRDWGDEPPNEQQINDYMTLALHIVQGLKEMDGEAI